MRPDQFMREARRWTADPPTRRQRRGRLPQTAGTAQRTDLRRRRRHGAPTRRIRPSHGPPHRQPAPPHRRTHAPPRPTKRHQPRNGEKRNLSQCLADALDHLTATSTHNSTAGSGASARTAGGSTTGSGSTTGGSATGSDDNEGTTGAGTTGRQHHRRRRRGLGGQRWHHGGVRACRMWTLCVVAHVDDDTGKLVGELPDGSRLPQSVLDELTCNAAITAAIFDRCGKPIWRTHHRTAGPPKPNDESSKPAGADAFHCRANFAICQPHHINPVSQGGPNQHRQPRPRHAGHATT